MRRVARCQGCHERGRQLRRPYIFSEIQVLLPSKGKGHDWTNDDGIGKRFPRRIEHPLDVPVQGPHDADPRHHSRAAVAFGDQDQDFNGSLPLLELLFGLRELGDVPAGILERDKLATAGQRDRIFEFAFPAPCFRRSDARAPGSATRF
jgi:hypothetical protein